MKEIVRYSHCFVCGEQNNSGLKARFFEENGEAITELAADRAFEGYQGIYHGGIISTLLDEIMIKAILAQGFYVVTAEMTVRYHRPVAIGEKMRFRGRITSRRGRLFNAEGEVVGSDGTPCASATGKYVEAKASLRSKLIGSIES